MSPVVRWLQSGDIAHRREPRLRWWLVPRRLCAEFTASWLLRGRMLREAPNASPWGDPHYGAVALTWTFRASVGRRRHAGAVRADSAAWVRGETGEVHESSEGSAHGATRLPLDRPQLARLVRLRLPGLLLDETGGAPAEGAVAVYTLSDPRDLRDVRYVGQTRSPQRRLLQHIHTARLWLPDDLPWWFGKPKLRPLYDWIRALHRDEYRLPVMLVTAWTGSVRAARLAERELIHAHLNRRQELFNVEREILERQVPLL